MAELTQEIALPLQPRLLVAADDATTTCAIKEYLPHCRIAVSETAAGAIEQLDSSRHDLLLLDALLPHGNSLIEQVRARPGGMPILMMSGELYLPRFIARLTHRPDDFIEKPFMPEALVAKIEHLLAVHARRQAARRQRAELAELHERRERELDVARTIFDRIFSRGQFDRDTIRHLVVPADRLAGDVVFGAWAGPGRYRWMIGDVTGHTLSSALVTMLLAGAFYHFTDESDKPMDQLLRRLEREMVGVLPSNMFCAGAVCELDRNSHTLQVWNGGNPDILIRHGDGAITRIASTGTPIASDRFSEPSHPIVTHEVTPGDRVFAFSDGLVEVRDPRGRMLGLDHLIEVVRSGEADTVFPRLLGCIPEYTGTLGYDDDISVVEVIV